MTVPRESDDDPRLGWRSGVLLALALAALYGLTFDVRSDGQLLGNDAMPYAHAAASGRPEGLANAHHLLFHPVANALGALLALVGDSPPVLAVLRAQRGLAALGGGASAVLLLAIARRLTSRTNAALIAALYAVSYGPWLLAAVGETYTPAIAACGGLLLVALDMRLGLRHESAPALGLLLLLAVLLRQDAVLVVVALPWLVSARAALLSVGFAGLTSLALYAAAWAVSGVELGFAPWLRGLAGDGTWGHAPGLGEVGLAAGLTATGVHYGWVPLRRVLGGNADELLQPHLLSAVVAFCGVGLAALVAESDDGRTPARRRIALAFATFAIVRFGFFAWWEPGNVEHHTGTLLPLLALLALALGRRSGSAPRAGLVVAAALTLATNALVAFLPNRGRTTWERAREVAALAGPDGLVVGLNAFAHHALLRDPPEGTVLDGVPAAVAREPAARERLQNRGIRVLERGGTVVLFRAVEIWDRLLLVEPPIDFGVVEQLASGGRVRYLSEGETIWGAVIEPE